jgi:hypothetical protein
LSKKSKHPRYDDPSAFRQQFPRIVEVTDGSMSTPLSGIAAAKIFTMGKCKLILHEADAKLGWFMSVRRSDHYPSWDELVWLRYNLIPDAAIMMLKLPNLNSYINQENPEYKNVFTMEQQGWALDPPPSCCGQNMIIDAATQSATAAAWDCPTCGKSMQIDFNTWNEQHGNGFLAKEKGK